MYVCHDSKINANRSGFIPGCGDKKDEGRTAYTVSFDTGGGIPVPSPRQAEAGGTITAPAANPAKTGYQFSFRHTEGSTSAHGFHTPVHHDFTLYARWQEANAEEPAEEPVRQTVAVYAAGYESNANGTVLKVWKNSRPLFTYFTGHESDTAKVWKTEKHSTASPTAPKNPVPKPSR
ncbi:MAG: InlB B-repeat-containing protein [Tannerellaceae bacterium]|jgi:hypothetical protein|nr:InlB B-repeat-containing protein [Tannerellaceae bacterium]